MVCLVSGLSPISVPTGSELFPGRDNVLILTQEFDLTVRCNFQLHMFPFDTQRCSMEVLVFISMIKSTRHLRSKSIMTNVTLVSRML